MDDNLGEGDSSRKLSRLVKVDIKVFYYPRL